MAFNPYVNPAFLRSANSNNNCQVNDLEGVQIAGVMDIADDFDVVLFSAENTLIKNDRTLPAGAVVVPTLRRKEKKVGIFSLALGEDKEELTLKLNHLGFSITHERVLIKDDFERLEEVFPYAENERILMVCSDVLNEVSFAHACGIKTLLIGHGQNVLSKEFGIGSHYIASSV